MDEHENYVNFCGSYTCAFVREHVSCAEERDNVYGQAKEVHLRECVFVPTFLRVSCTSDRYTVYGQGKEVYLRECVFVSVCSRLSGSGDKKMVGGKEGRVDVVR